MKKITVLLVFAIAGTFAFSLSSFNNNLTEDELKILEEGKILITSSSYKKMCLDSDCYAAKRLKEEVYDLKPAYFAEIIQTYPYEGNEDFPQRFGNLIMDIKSYVGIPYFSERVQSWYDLYESAEILSREEKDGCEIVLADLVMEPFDLINTEITTEQGEEFYYYKSTNLSLMRYLDRFDCVKPRNMKSIIIVYRDGDNWVMYGVGAVRAPSIFFLRERVETSFMNRIKTFCSYFCEKIS